MPLYGAVLSFQPLSSQRAQGDPFKHAIHLHNIQRVPKITVGDSNYCVVGMKLDEHKKQVELVKVGGGGVLTTLNT